MIARLRAWAGDRLIEWGTRLLADDYASHHLTRTLERVRRQRESLAEYERAQAERGIGG